ncbi:MAG: hypothetical protein JW994_03665 [Candidatus Omnitrophica bacterium]|nr:hypothetical protein [Candidatus Omnitrophota bacterium]
MKKGLKYLTIVIAAFAISVAGIGRLPQFITILTLCILGLYLIRRIIDANTRRRASILFLAVFLLQVMISIFLYAHTVDTKYYGFSYKGDDYVYGDFGVLAGKLWRKGIFPSIKGLEYLSLIGRYSPVHPYQLYNAAIFYLFGACSGQIILILNCFFHAAIILPVFFICKELNIRSNVILFAFFLFLFWPSTFFWSLFNFKEPIYLLVDFVIFSMCIKWQKDQSIGTLILLGFLSFVLFMLKPHIKPWLAILFLYLLFTWRLRYRHLAAIILAVIFVLRQILKKSFFADLYRSFSLLPKTFSERRYASYFTNTSYLWNLPTDTWLATIIYLPFGMLLVLFLPFLLRPFELQHVAANVESIAWWALMPFLIGGIWVSITKELRKTFLVIVMFFFWIAAMALTQSSMGTLIRQKAIIYYIGFVFIALAIDRAMDKVEDRDGG